MGNRVKHIVQIFFDVESPNGVILTRDFVEYRYSFFKKYTYRSLMNQTFKDFEIWLLCGHRHRDFTSTIDLDGVKVLHSKKIDISEDTFVINKNKNNDWKSRMEFEEFAHLEDDYIAITTMGSDDLYHKNALSETAKITKDIIKSKPKTRKRIVFRDFIYWDTVNHFLLFGRRENSAFYTHVFPKSMYRDWETLRIEHYQRHRFMGRIDDIESSSNKITVTNHEMRISRIKRNKKYKIYNEDELKELKERNPDMIYTQLEMNKLLKEFGVNDYEKSI